MWHMIEFWLAKALSEVIIVVAVLLCLGLLGWIIQWRQKRKDHTNIKAASPRP